MILNIIKFNSGSFYKAQGAKGIFFRKQFAEYSSVVLQYTKKISSIRDAIQESGGVPENTDLELGQGKF
jgi:hypothetical protein